MVAAEEGAVALVQGGDACAQDGDVPLAGPVDAADEVEQRALAAAAVAQQDDELAAVELVIHLVQHHPLPAAFLKRLAQSFQADDGRGSLARRAFANHCLSHPFFDHRHLTSLTSIVCQKAQGKRNIDKRWTMLILTMGASHFLEWVAPSGVAVRRCDAPGCIPLSGVGCTFWG